MPIPSKTLRFWGFERHPFADNILKDDLLKLFIDRKAELSDVEDALGYSRVVGVYGTLGVGKSSFLQKLRQILCSDGYPVAYIHLSADSEGTFYRELLAELLVLLNNKNLKLKPKSDVKLRDEAIRLYASVSQSRGANFGAKLLGILGGNFTENKTKRIAAHDEVSSRGSICKIFNRLNVPLVVIFDDFEKLRYESNGATRDYFLILSRFIATLEEQFNHEEVSFVVSMDTLVENHIARNRKEGGEFAFSLNSLCKLPNLKIKDLHDFIRVRLRTYKWKGGVSAFLTEEAFLALSLASSNHPRRAVRILAKAMKAVSDDENKSQRRIDFKSMCLGAKNAGCPLDDKDWIVLKYLREHGESSANDDRLREALGYATPKRSDGYSASVDRRLRSIATQLRLEFEEVPSGKTKKNVLNSPELPKGW